MLNQVAGRLNRWLKTMAVPGFLRMVMTVMVVVLLAAACGSDTGTSADQVGGVSQEVTEDAADPPAPTGSGGGVDLSLERSDVDCTAEGLGSDDENEFFNAHYVVEGNLGAVCFGDEDPTLVQAWEELAVITPGLQLADLGLFGGFIGGGEGDEVTLAFVNSLDDAGTLFQMSVNLDSYDEDTNEALLTMAHEFTHVFTAQVSQIDRSVDSAAGCDTYYNAEGCYLPGSVMAQWIQLFWGNGLIDQIDPDAEASGADGEARCALNGGFFGPYAASSPEEDFAESFSAFVYQLDTNTPGQQAKFDWMASQAGLVEFRDRAIAAGIGPLQNNFDPCGSE